MLQIKQEGKDDEISHDTHEDNPTSSHLSSHNEETIEVKDNGPEYFQFQCALCSFDVRARYGELKMGKLEYIGKVYYTRSPFREYDRAKKPTIRDYVVIGSKCCKCYRDVCVKIQCSFHYEQNYCVQCIMQNRNDFPDKVIQHIVSRNNKYQRPK